MKFKEKLKNLPKIALLSAAISSAFVGCATTSWEAVRQEYKPTGIERKVILSTTPKKEKTIEFNISEPYKENRTSKVQIKESLKEINYILKSVRTKKEFEEILIEERKIIKEDFLLEFIFGSLGGGCIGLVGGVIDTLVKEPDHPVATILGNTLLGTSIGAGLFAVYALTKTETKTETETRGRRTGMIKGEYSNEKVEKEFLDERLIYDNNPASDISVKLSGEGRYGMRTTNSKGELNLSRFVDLLSPQYFFRDYTNSQLEKRIGNIPLVQQIKPRTLETLIKDLIHVVSPKEVRLTVSTEEESSDDYVIKNDSRTFKLKGHQLTDDAIYKIVRQFVDEEINSCIKSLEFTVKDTVSHIPIKGSNFELESKAPSKTVLAGRYFTQELKDYAKKYIEDYLIGNTTIWDSPETISFDVYSPSRIFLEVTHPDYNFVSGQVLVGNKDAKKTVYMVDKGSKIRVKNADDERGRIE